MKIKAPAKLNLYLHITGRRADGYHLLEGLFVFTEFADAITIMPAAQLSLTIDGPFQSSLDSTLLENNLIYRAAWLLKNKYNISQGAAIHLTKNIPIGAGLGGGSSDAAAVLRAFNQFWHLQLSEETLRDVGLSLGADVPACIVGKPAIVSGIGEIIHPISLPNKHPVLLVNPHIHLSTQQVFQAYHKSDQPFSQPMTQTVSLQETRNDLENASIALAPAIRDLLTALAEQPQCVLARMSGSGSTCFAVFHDHASAESAEQHLKTLFPTYWIQRTEIPYPLVMPKFSTQPPINYNSGVF